MSFWLEMVVNQKEKSAGGRHLLKQFHLSNSLCWLFHDVQRHEQHAQGSFGGIQITGCASKWCHWNLPKETVYKWGHGSATRSVLTDVLYTSLTYLDIPTTCTLLVSGDSSDVIWTRMRWLDPINCTLLLLERHPRSVITVRVAFTGKLQTVTIFFA